MRVMVLTTRKRIVITEQEELAITGALDNDSERITVGGVPYKKSLIGYFDEPTTEEIQTHSVKKVFPDAQFELPSNRCRAQFSIQLEINNIAKDEGGKDWPRLIRDKKWRAKIYKKLWEQSDNWCDDKKGTCACQPGFVPSPRKVSIEL